MNTSITSSRKAVLDGLADELLAATVSLVPVAPLRDRLQGMTLSDSYDVQNSQLEQHLANGRVLAGRKVGLTSVAMQRQLGVDSPDFGFFFEDMVHHDGARIPASTFIQPKVEPEFGFVLKESLQGPGITLEQAAAAIGAIYPAIEIIDSRITDWDIKLVDTVADNASCGAIAVGTTPLDIDPADLQDVTCSLVIDGEVTGTGTGADVMGNPVAPLAWLANVLGEQGVALEAGQLVLPGSFTAAMPVVTDSTATADFGPLGSLTIHFTD
ncbi:2-keto-4-pentenoate hydratase [Arthrobacter pascens]|uniref:2-keto-4-pentenoate hydratase n=1 Tax=Arthrobacter pascens TaxID=1677 RepID=UPI00278947E8|nr:fumarylacetoacetate hydrolase family protein [Arthrobacter pascens]MDQ0634315.1 2-keto-4-pentenoate hydratase [Arthrobacter pascens]MDQ0678903.1 2-keto-4-pentenoate hydratase [Arthrobacter pascens]